MSPNPPLLPPVPNPRIASHLSTLAIRLWDYIRLEPAVWTFGALAEDLDGQETRQTIEDAIAELIRFRLIFSDRGAYRPQSRPLPLARLPDVRGAGERHAAVRAYILRQKKAVAAEVAAAISASEATVSGHLDSLWKARVVAQQYRPGAAIVWWRLPVPASVPRDPRPVPARILRFLSASDARPAEIADALVSTPEAVGAVLASLAHEERVHRGRGNLWRKL